VASVTDLFLVGTQGFEYTESFKQAGTKARLVIVKTSSRHRGMWGGLLLLAILAAQPAYARVHHSEAWAREHFATAERMREALNGRPSRDRTRHDYQRVLNAYRSVCAGAPASAKADPSVVAVAETMVEMGRLFDDDKILNGAIEQFKFLRREYPGSKYRFDGLFTIGEIYKDDLNDPEAARATFQDFLRRYPRNRLANDARQAILQLNEQAEADKAEKAQKTAGKELPQGDKHAAGPSSAEDGSPEPSPGRLPRVTGVRHWSTPDYSRVAIDLEGDVKFSSRRIAHPSRIFFDLPDTKVASTLVGKSFDVDDGFLKKVRVAQFARGRTRVVLEVDSLSAYDAFMLPNPYRLIIDIHGRSGQAKPRKKPVESSSAADAAPAPQTDLKLEPVSSDTTSPVAHADLTEPTEASSPNDAGSDSAIASTSEAPAVVKKPQTGVVKKIVDVDDDDTEDGTVPGAAVSKRSASKEVASRTIVKKIVDNDLEGKPESPDSGTGPRKLAPPRSRSTSRQMAYGRSGVASDLDIREARPTSAGDRSLTRALGLKIGKIVIDPGHGGHDTGTIGPNGLEEKDLVLEVGRRLGKLLQTRLGAEVVYTRKNDTFIPLETRTAIANQARADLFVSIHANSSHDPDARGVETYYLNFTSSPEALEVAARENAVSEKSIYELQDLVKKIALKEKIEESREFAGDVQASLHSGLAVKSPAIRDRGVKKAPFVVLIGANMPSILAEISFVSNPTDEHRLATSEYRERIAESLYRGIAKYVNGLSGVKVASKMEKSASR
jgi:N-acetylmuramoyl-L-alanine amidase